ncbi:MAG: hypothetical protein K8R59_14250 [Thermoanaerobaculales bacterium]|nr:hypothetical protein [Thermoanaerobaculales bacterium]
MTTVDSTKLRAFVDLSRDEASYTETHVYGSILIEAEGTDNSHLQAWQIPSY